MRVKPAVLCIFSIVLLTLLLTANCLFASENRIVRVGWFPFSGYQEFDSKGNPQQLHLLQACFGEFHGAIHRLEVMNAEQAKQRDGVSLPQLVSGDVVLVPTEAAIDTFLYWDGKRYQLYLPDEVP